jgi:polyisoprenoid-binding protein YceI
VIKSSEKTKTGLKIKGDLTFIGKTNPIEFDAVVSNVKGVYTAKSNVVLDRTKWDLKYGSTDFFKGLGDKAINNEFTLAINLSAKK